jgi:hypothetical protein
VLTAREDGLEEQQEMLLRTIHDYIE